MKSTIRNVCNFDAHGLKSGREGGCELKNTVLFGAGQTGAMTARLLGAGYRALCFADNSPEKQGGTLAGLPVLPLREALELMPDCVCLCVLDDMRSGQMEAQLRALGYAGPVMRPDALLTFDARAATMRLLAEQMRMLGTCGDAAELGVYRGEFAALINAAFPDRMLHLFDTFKGFPARDVEVERRLGLSPAKEGDFSGTSEAAVLELMPHPELVKLYPGCFPESFGPCEGLRFAFVSIDADLYAPTSAALPLFWDRLSRGGALLIHDVNGTQYAGAGRAVYEFCSARGFLPMPVCDLHGSVVLRKG